jgi:putative hydrolase of the HAD superfamily
MNDRELIRIIREGSHPLEPEAAGLQPRGAPRRGVRALLLDVYGTLLISGSGDIGTSAPAACSDGRLGSLLSRYGIRRAPGEVREAFAGSVREMHEREKRRGVRFPEVRVERIWRDVLGLDAPAARVFAVEYEVIVNPVWPMPGLDVLVGRIRLLGGGGPAGRGPASERAACGRHAAGRLVAGIISNAQFFTPLHLCCFLGAPPEEAGFSADLLFYSYRMGHAKPSPLLYRAAADALAGEGIAAENVLCVGNDMLNDVAPAAGAGFQTAFFAGDRRSLRLREDDPRCRGIEPDIVVTDLHRLADHLVERGGA